MWEVFGPWSLRSCNVIVLPPSYNAALYRFFYLIGILMPTMSWWLGSRVVSVLDSGAEGPGSNRSRDAVE